MDGLRLAFSWLTVLPLRTDRLDPRTCREAITYAPVVGATIGVVGVVVLWVLMLFGAPSLLAGLITIGLLVLVTRGMHVDGLADTVDGLGCYGPPERALAVMRDGSTGPFAVVSLIVVLGVQVVSFGQLAATARWPAVILACACGRAAFVLCCRQGVAAARPGGMGALVAGTQPSWIAGAWWGALAVSGAFAVSGRWWQGVLAVALAAVLISGYLRHVRRRFGGITGDILGAASEITTAVVVAVCAFA